MLNKSKIEQYGDELYNALVTRTPVAPLTDREAEITIEDAYQIQQRGECGWCDRPSTECEKLHIQHLRSFHPDGCAE